MKTSNKLLLALAIVLILVPIIVIAIKVEKGRRDKDIWFNAAENKVQFSTPFKGYIAEEIKAPFKAVDFQAVREVYLNVRLITAPGRGIKFQEQAKGNVHYRVDDQGILRISVKDFPRDGYAAVTLYIYAPDVTALYVQHAFGLSLHAKADSLYVDAQKLSMLDINDNSKFNKLNLHADSIGFLSLKQPITNKLHLNLKNTSFESNKVSYELLDIHTAGNTYVRISGAQPGKADNHIQNFLLNTTGNESIEMDHIGIDKFSGSISDQTKLQMPVTILRKVLR